MNILITGTTGYIGYKLAMAAVKKGYHVNALVRNVLSPNLPQHPDITFFRGDITDPCSIILAVKDCDFVFHAAGLTQLWNKDRRVFYNVNVEGTRNMLEASWREGVKKFVFTSSCAVLGPSNERPVTEDDPRIIPYENDYEISKHCAEELVKE
ncbi:MAG: NAD-dependent epimerase/dehydratase family protein, partial [Chitinophagaceae bacterium]